MQESRDSGKVGCITVIGCRTGGMQDRWDAGHVGGRTGGMHERRYAGKEGFMR